MRIPFQAGRSRCCASVASPPSRSRRCSMIRTVQDLAFEVRKRTRNHVCICTTHAEVTAQTLEQLHVKSRSIKKDGTEAQL